jgi:hypothetical protein
MMDDKALLAFSCNYPFSSTAKELLKSIGEKANNPTYIDIGKSRVQEAIDNGNIKYRNDIFDINLVISYAYSRLIISALNNPYLMDIYIKAEAKRSIIAMTTDNENNIKKLCVELGFNIEMDNRKFNVKVTDFLNAISNINSYKLINQPLKSGFIIMDIQEFAGMLEGIIYEKIKIGLPILKKDIPKMLLGYANEIKIPKPKIEINTSRSEEWIEKLLANPIPDVRQRVVNLILAPYLINVKKLDVELAYKIIVEYIDKCKILDPTTKITNAQIKYQCEYSKSKGMKPLSKEKALELLSGVVDSSHL